MANTNQEITMEFRGETIVIPAGTRITHNTALGVDANYNFVSDLNWYRPELKGYTRTMATHDMVHYGINVESRFVTEECKHCNNDLCDAQQFNEVCFNCGKKPL